MSSYHRNEYYNDYHQQGSIVSDGFPAVAVDSSVVVDSFGHDPSDGRFSMDFDGHPQQVHPGEESAFDDIPDILLLNHYCSHSKFLGCKTL
jgi:hypothetical protein